MEHNVDVAPKWWLRTDYDDDNNDACLNVEEHCLCLIKQNTLTTYRGNGGTFPFILKLNISWQW